MYQERKYRKYRNSERFTYFSVIVKESDLLVGISPRHYNAELLWLVREEIKRLRRETEGYAMQNPGFINSHVPVDAGRDAPATLQEMISAAVAANVGPMASVAGMVSQGVAGLLKGLYPDTEYVIENGGDIACLFRSRLTVGLETASSRITGSIGVSIGSDLSPCGICSSSGTFGHSFSYGRADSVSVICRSPVVADAWATSLCNRISAPDDLGQLAALVKSKREILACVAIAGDKIMKYGDIELVKL